VTDNAVDSSSIDCVVTVSLLGMFPGEFPRKLQIPHLPEILKYPAVRLRFGMTEPGNSNHFLDTAKQCYSSFQFLK